MIRLRQIALIADDLDPVVDELRDAFGLPVCFHDPGVGEFGLRNALLLVGDQFLEVLSPIEDDTAVGRLLAKRGGPGGYMVIHEVDDLDERVARFGEHEARIVWSGDFPDIRGRHLHPADVGGAIVSIDEPVPAGSWRWGGPEWEQMRHAGTAATVDAITGVAIAAADPDGLAARWAELGIDEAVTFVARGDEPVDGIVRIDVRSVDRRRVGEECSIGGVTFRTV
ncbi:MAG TPA: VOC family protein [Ilumatobacteraceae bacterium]|nr:VOC family protein [Ilumatobacteraceae bacterium]